MKQGDLVEVKIVSDYKIGIIVSTHVDPYDGKGYVDVMESGSVRRYVDTMCKVLNKEDVRS
jgi:hypothetical protein